MRFTNIVVFDEDSNILVLRRSSTHARLALQPDLPGGIVEAHETFEDGAIRELMEETGIRATTDDLVTYYRSKKLLGMQYVVFTMNIQQVKPGVTVSWEHDQYTWQNPNIVKGLNKFVQPIIDTIVKQSSS